MPKGQFAAGAVTAAGHQPLGAHLCGAMDQAAIGIEGIAAELARTNRLLPTSAKNRGTTVRFPD